MADEEKEVPKQMPGASFSPGNVTLFQIAESHGQNIGQRSSIPAGAIVEDKYKEILEKAIPADRIERVLASKANAQVQKVEKPKTKLMSIPVEKGMIFRHKKTNQKVKVKKAYIGKSSEGIDQHQVKLFGDKSDKTFIVKESNLIPL
jgi:hypothetical protein